MAPSLVSVLLAAHDAEQFLDAAVRSILGQTQLELELVVVDDGSSDRTPDLLAAVADPRLVVVRNEQRSGLAVSLNRALEVARGRYVARLDADDVALPRRLERQLAALRARPELAIIGTGVLELDEAGRAGRTHLMPSGSHAVRWHAHFGSPFLHPTVLFDREVLERHGLCYAERFEESEDYDLWSRLLDVADGDNLAEPHVLYRVHPGQATARRRDLQRAFQREVALRRIRSTAPALGDERAELAWQFGAGEPLAAEAAGPAVDAFLELLAAFEALHGTSGSVRAAAARAVLRAGHVRRALALRPVLAMDGAAARARRRRLGRAARRDAERTLRRLRGAAAGARPVRVTVVSPEPTPFRSLLFDRLAQRPEMEFEVLYSGRTIFGRTWMIEHRHPHRFLGGVRVPGVRRLLRHEYPVTTGIFRALITARPDVVVVSGWSTFAAQGAVLWCRAKRVPYVILVESNDRDPRPSWRRTLKRLVATPVVRRADRVLAIGTLARESVLARGADPARVGWFANTVDVPAFFERADRLAGQRAELRAGLGASDSDVVVLSVARLAPEKGIDTLVRATAATAERRLLVVVAGEGPARGELEELARALGVRLSLLGDLQPWDRVFDCYAAADVFALLSRHEPWGVVVNEAAAFGLPLVLSDRVGAAFDLLDGHDNGVLVPVDDVTATADALRRLADDPSLRRTAGARSRELMRAWGYEPSIENFVMAVLAAAAR
jgi:glycosyltransferase involved in cell wall biosynthesis